MDVPHSLLPDYGSKGIFLYKWEWVWKLNPRYVALKFTRIDVLLLISFEKLQQNYVNNTAHTLMYI